MSRESALPWGVGFEINYFLMEWSQRKFYLKKKRKKKMILTWIFNSTFFHWQNRVNLSLKEKINKWLSIEISCQLAFSEHSLPDKVEMCLWVAFQTSARDPTQGFSDVQSTHFISELDPMLNTFFRNIFSQSLHQYSWLYILIQMEDSMHSLYFSYLWQH